MELVPIIQISLALFSGLLLLVLLISYIVFKMNKSEQTTQIQPEYGMQMSHGYYSEMRQEQSYPQTLSVYNEYNPSYNGMESQQLQAQPAPRNEYSSRQGRYTVVYNETASGEKQAYYPERASGYKHRFAPTKNTNAFAQFK
ncbi:MAG: hypothetical protein HF312_06585 [Ignavibacteria bacterium]|jgi:hypothetical protein|nr:hypothetical protein [Ignavibacteria bacterium]MCU7519868.1 hypothetical protein [Ignavibacteria bacterium]